MRKGQVDLLFLESHSRGCVCAQQECGIWPEAERLTALLFKIFPTVKERRTRRTREKVSHVYMTNERHRWQIVHGATWINKQRQLLCVQYISRAVFPLLKTPIQTKLQFCTIFCQTWRIITGCTGHTLYVLVTDSLKDLSEMDYCPKYGSLVFVKLINPETCSCIYSNAEIVRILYSSQAAEFWTKDFDKAALQTIKLSQHSTFLTSSTFLFRFKLNILM